MTWFFTQNYQYVKYKQQQQNESRISNFFTQKYQCVEYKLQQKGIKYDSIHLQLQIGCRE